VAPASLSNLASRRLALLSYSDGQTTLQVANADGSGLRDVSGDVALVLSPSWSPDGTRLIFYGCADADAECTSDMEVFVVNPDGSALYNLTQDPAEDWHPAWSPDGDQIAFTSDRLGSRDIFALDLRTLALRRVTDSPYEEDHAQWSPDGGQIAYQLTRGSQTAPWVTKLDGTGTANLAPVGVEPRWSPAGDRIAFGCAADHHSSICVVRPDGSQLQHVTSEDADAFSYSWSPDGGMIAYVTNRDSNAEIYLAHVGYDGLVTHDNLTQDPASDQWPVWSPDGTVIAYSSDGFLTFVDVETKDHMTLGIEAFGPIAWMP
jgi:TolB protein